MLEFPAGIFPGGVCRHAVDAEATEARRHGHERLAAAEDEAAGHAGGDRREFVVDPQRPGVVLPQSVDVAAVAAIDEAVRADEVPFAMTKTVGDAVLAPPAEDVEIDDDHGIETAVVGQDHLLAPAPVGGHAADPFQATGGRIDRVVEVLAADGHPPVGQGPLSQQEFRVVDGIVLVDHDAIIAEQAAERLDAADRRGKDGAQIAGQSGDDDPLARHGRVAPPAGTLVRGAGGAGGTEEVLGERRPEKFVRRRGVHLHPRAAPLDRPRRGREMGRGIPREFRHFRHRLQGMFDGRHEPAAYTPVRIGRIAAVVDFLPNRTERPPGTDFPRAPRRLPRLPLAPPSLREVYAGGLRGRFTREVYAGGSRGRFTWEVHLGGDRRWRCRRRAN